MSSSLNVAENWLMRIDRSRALERATEAFGRLAEVDPKLATAKVLLQERFDEVPAERHETLTAALWTYARPVMTQERLDAFRFWLDDGAEVLRAVERTLGEAFALPVLHEVIDVCAAAESSDAATLGVDLQQAFADIRRLKATNSVLVVGFLLGVGAATVYSMVVEGYTLEPPHTAPPVTYPRGNG